MPETVNPDARVIPADVALGVDFDGLLYVEAMGAITPALITEDTRICDGRTERYLATRQLRGEWLFEDNYGVTWRGWTAWPTDIQREKTPWNPRQHMTYLGDGQYG